MRQLTFNKVYIGLLIMALISALIIPKPIPSKMMAQVQSLFVLVSYPVRQTVGRIYGRLHSAPPDMESPADAPRTYLQIAQENRELRLQLANLTEQLARLQEINAQREALGPLRQYSRPMRVTGADTQFRRSLSLGGNIEGLQPGMAVLYPGGLAGRLDRVGWRSGAQVTLITDKTFRIGARFGRLDRHDNTIDFAPVGNFTCVAEGDGTSGLVVRNIRMKDAKEAGLSPGDWVVVADSEYPPALQGYRIGQVTQIRPSRSSALFAEVDVKPQGDLQKLSEVMVLVAKP